jgi:hypothetical protein
MHDFTLTAEELLEPTTKPRRVVTSGIAPTADIPTTRRPERPACYGPCPACGQPVLTGRTRSGTRLVLEDVHVPTYVVLQVQPDTLPLLEQSRGIPVHRCQP